MGPKPKQQPCVILKGVHHKWKRWRSLTFPYTSSASLLRNTQHESSALFVVTRWNPWLEPGWPLLLFAGVPELSGVISRASQKGHGGERPASEACSGAGSHAGRAEPVLGGIAGDLLRRVQCKNIDLTAKVLTAGNEVPWWTRPCPTVPCGSSSSFLLWRSREVDHTN